MANRGRPTQLKRQRERARQDRHKVKEARRLESKARPHRPVTPGEDPDLEGIQAGPQPLADWQLDVEPDVVEPDVEEES